MKNFKNFKFLSFLFVLGMIVTSCVQDDDFKTPAINQNEPDITANFDIASIKALYGEDATQPIFIESNNPLYIEAYVVSSDETGNFYKTMVIQDKPEAPEHGISISTEATDTYTFYEPGRKIYFRVDSLYVGEYAGLPTIGIQGASEPGRIGIDDFEKRIFRSNEVSELVPTAIDITEINDAKLNTLIKLNEVQFPDNLLGEHYANLNDTFGVNREVEDCDGNVVILRNSGFADFKNELLPEGNGTLTAVLSKFNTDYQLLIRDTDDVNFDGERCVSEFLECDGTAGGNTIIFSQDFEGYSSISDATNDGWLNVNAAGGPTKYVLGSFSSNNYAQISAYNSGDNDVETYLVTPSINLDSSTDEALTFDLEVAFANGKVLEVLITNNFTGDVTTTDWTKLDVTIPNTPTGGFGGLMNVGDINISCLDGDIRVAFRYTGTDAGANTRYHIDNVEVNGN